MPSSKKTIDWYNKNAANYAKHVRTHKDSVYHAYYEKPAIRSELPDLKNKSVISLGCGSGEDTHYLKMNGAIRAVGIDISINLIKIAKRDYPECDFFVMDMQKLDFPNKSFDLVYSSLAMHYLIGGHLKTLQEAFRILKPGGMLLFSDGHPIGSAMECVEDNANINDLRIQIRKNIQSDTEEIKGNYLDSRINMAGNDWLVEYWHQPIGKTINQIIEAGFVLDRVNEFKPAKKMKIMNPRVYSRLTKIPEMIIYKAHKPKEKIGIY